MNAIPHSERNYKYSEKGIIFGWIFALLSSEELQGDGSSDGGVNYLNKGHQVGMELRSNGYDIREVQKRATCPGFHH